MLTHPQFDPVAISLGPMAIRWYGLMYLVGFVLFIVLGNVRIRKGNTVFTPKMLDDLLFWGVLGVILGGRLGQVLFYEPGYYLDHPLEIFMVWKGGMSFHGGFLGVLAASWLFARRNHLSFWQVTDFVAPLVPLGLAAGRLGNFINGELWGRVTAPDKPWAMLFPQARGEDLQLAAGNPQYAQWFAQYGALPRHASQLYEVLLEGLVLFVVLWWFTSRPRARGQASAVFLIGYGIARFVCEYFRSPDEGIFGHSYLISMGQWLSLPMILAGAILWQWSRRHADNRFLR
ncbi:prolipoprotein diacylglyceryl transferase [Laribacter hongkongensis]|uniref:prolipoprotein diacylglyceryl transferase n=1 Tax=Laribacter hongkongensis TaxID=168471 RepID=UPI001EFDD8C6|nr:prolipoprotein diacylglyceryl transferase [Laribacter hongkongensis]MCG9080819.1 prolipoprotein diacylglyceryl transferase [Laribacter hongkongensis]MCG9096508.1 prolipoprotein diacylglyceryl transferase [Laribacter hongkongensis]MCG9124420.1 prolipoprotein diacylglyceryl transferase [Laribacter hongkongensis]